MGKLLKTNYRIYFVKYTLTLGYRLQPYFLKIVKKLTMAIFFGPLPKAPFFLISAAPPKHSFGFKHLKVAAPSLKVVSRK
jgi:hypothetical protein